MLLALKSLPNSDPDFWAQLNQPHAAKPIPETATFNEGAFDDDLAIPASELRKKLSGKASGGTGLTANGSVTKNGLADTLNEEEDAQIPRTRMAGEKQVEGGEAGLSGLRRGTRERVPNARYAGKFWHEG